VTGLYRTECESPSEAAGRLRISLTDRCNYACFFCHNEGQAGYVRRDRALRVSDFALVATACRIAGITKIKLTGGEPLIYRAPDGDVVDAVREIRRAFSGTRLDLSMTTNGELLADRVDQLCVAGLDRVTISLATLDYESHRQLISRTGHPKAVLDAIDAAAGAGLGPVKVNTVVFGAGPSGPGNIAELPQIIDECRRRGVRELRLYPMLPTSPNVEFEPRYHYWDQELMAAILDACKRGIGGPSAPPDIATILADVVNGRFEQDATGKRLTLLVDVGNLTLAMNMMSRGRARPSKCSDCRSTNDCAEGVYALRLSAGGDLRACLYGSPVATLARVDGEPLVVSAVAMALRRTQDRLIDIYT
jgi:molybdenum cofactor biosynthesis enzyme MoaA